MSAGDEIIGAIGKPEALVHAEIHAMRQVADAISLQGKQTVEHIAASTRAMEKLSDKVDGMNERLIRLEEQKHGREIESLKDEIKGLSDEVDGLKSLRDRQAGAMSVGGWISKYAPWLVAIFMAGLAGIGIKTGANG